MVASWLMSCLPFIPTYPMNTRNTEKNESLSLKPERGSMSHLFHTWLEHPKRPFTFSSYEQRLVVVWPCMKSPSVIVSPSNTHIYFEKCVTPPAPMCMPYIDHSNILLTDCMSHTCAQAKKNCDESVCYMERCSWRRIFCVIRTTFTLTAFTEQLIEERNWRLCQNTVGDTHTS